MDIEAYGTESYCLKIGQRKMEAILRNLLASQNKVIGRVAMMLAVSVV